jgi:hypothetical protein
MSPMRRLLYRALWPSPPTHPILGQWEAELQRQAADPGV